MTNQTPTPDATPAVTPEQQRELEQLQRRTLRFQSELQRMPGNEYAVVFQATVLGALIGLVTEQQFEDVLLRASLTLEENVRTMRAVARQQAAGNLIVKP